MRLLAHTVCLGCLGLAAAIAACGSEADDAPTSTFDGGSGSGGAAGASTGATGGGGVGGTAAGGSGGIELDAAKDSDSGCPAIYEEAKNKPLHLYIMMDKSNSMWGSQWASAKAGLEAFVKDPKSGGVYVGLKFFPRKADADPVCMLQPYAVPDTPFDLLPGNAQPIVDAINAQSPDGMSTPIYPALGGAITKGIEIAQNNPGHTSAVLLVTDGKPQGPAATCGGVNPEDPAVITALAANGAAYAPPVLTFVIGLPGVDQAFANAVAAAGGTDSAILVSSTNVQVEFQNALSKVRGEALPCELELPAKVTSGEIDLDQVNVLLTPGGGTQQTLLQTTDCAQGGDWYYDPAPPAVPTKIVLCPSTCDSLKKDYQATLEAQLGCPTQTVK